MENEGVLVKHSSWYTVHMMPLPSLALALGQVISASVAGDIQFLDVRFAAGGPFLSVDAHKGHLSSLAVHRHASVMASGSSTQYIRVSAECSGLSSTENSREHNLLCSLRLGSLRRAINRLGMQGNTPNSAVCAAGSTSG